MIKNMEVVLVEQNIYENKTVNSLILYFSIPAIFSLLVEIMASVVDTAFAGHLGEVSVEALTTMGLLSPILSLYTAFQALFAVSTSIMVARNLQDTKKRNEYFTAGLFMTCVMGIVVFVISYFGMSGILSFLGAEGQIRELSESYLKVQLWSNLFSALGYTLTSCVRAFGYPAMEMFLTGSSVVVNIVCNTIFVFGFQMNFVGLAYGTLVSEVFCVMLTAIYLIRHDLIVLKIKISFKKMRKYVSQLFKLGIAQTVIQSLGGCTAFFVNYSLLLNATLNHVAVWNVVQKIYTLLLMPIVGIAQGVQTIIAYFNGHNEELKKRKTLNLTLLYTVIYGLFGTIVVLFFGENILAIFAVSKNIYHIGKTVLGIVFLTFPLMGIFYTIMTLYEVTGHELKAVCLILTRQVFLMLPLVYLLPTIVPNYPYSIFLSVPIADSIALSLAVLIKKKNK